jgi:hypothetical protein
MQRFRRSGPLVCNLAAVLIGLGLLGTGLLGTVAQAADPVFPPASRVGIAPPENFVPSATFPGFQHNDKQAQIVVGELPGYAYDNLDKEISAEIERNPAAPRRQGISLKDGARGFVLKGMQSSPQGEVLKWTLVANAHDVTALVTALIPEVLKDVATEAVILESFSTLTIRAAVPVEEQLSVLPFSMRDLGGFRIVRVQPGMAAMLTDGPDNALEASSQPLILVSLTRADNAPELPQRDGFARRLIGDVPGLKDMRVLRSEPLRVANQQGHELLLEAKDAKTGVDLNVVQWLRFGAGTLMRIVGISRKDSWDDTYRRFRQVRDGIGSR